MSRSMFTRTRTTYFCDLPFKFDCRLVLLSLHSQYFESVTLLMISAQYHLRVQAHICHNAINTRALIVDVKYSQGV